MMKKNITTCIMSLTFVTTAFSQNIVCDFDTLTLPADSFWNGSDNTGGFTVENAYFPNTYDTIWDFWSSGWAYSNRVDSSTIPVDFSNYLQYMYNAKTGKGYNNSPNYLIGQQHATIHLQGSSKGKPVIGLFITNTTYAYNVIKFGNSFSKPFGGPSGNDPDFFRLSIHAWLNGVKSNDSAVVFLADYRQNNNALDYIIKDWVYVPLEVLGGADSIQFNLFSTDTGAFGMNTPAFFAVDQVVLADPAYSVEEHIKSEFKIYPNPVKDELYIISNDQNMFAEIFDISGKLIQSEYVGNTKSISTKALIEGVYYISIRSNTHKLTQAFIKIP